MGLHPVLEEILFGIMSNVRQRAKVLFVGIQGRSHSNKHFAEALVSILVEIGNCSSLGFLTFSYRRSDEDHGEATQYGSKKYCRLAGSWPRD